jgi:hypothetical protein
MRLEVSPGLWNTKRSMQLVPFQSPYSGPPYHGLAAASKHRTRLTNSLGFFLYRIL